MDKDQEKNPDLLYKKYKDEYTSFISKGIPTIDDSNFNSLVKNTRKFNNLVKNSNNKDYNTLIDNILELDKKYQKAKTYYTDNIKKEIQLAETNHYDTDTLKRSAILNVKTYLNEIENDKNMFMSNDIVKGLNYVIKKYTDDLSHIDRVETENDKYIKEYKLKLAKSYGNGDTKDIDTIEEYYKISDLYKDALSKLADTSDSNELIDLIFDRKAKLEGIAKSDIKDSISDIKSKHVPISEKLSILNKLKIINFDDFGLDVNLEELNNITNKEKSEETKEDIIPHINDAILKYDNDTISTEQFIEKYNSLSQKIKDLNIQSTNPELVKNFKDLYNYAKEVERVNDSVNKNVKDVEERTKKQIIKNLNDKLLLLAKMALDPKKGVLTEGFVINLKSTEEDLEWLRTLKDKTTYSLIKQYDTLIKQYNNEKHKYQMDEIANSLKDLKDGDIETFKIITKNIDEHIKMYPEDANKIMELMKNNKIYIKTSVIDGLIKNLNILEKNYTDEVNDVIINILNGDNNILGNDGNHYNDWYNNIMLKYQEPINENILDANAVEDILQGSSEEKEDITVPKTEKKLTTTTILIYILLAIVGIMLFLFIAITQLLLIWWALFLIALPWAVRAETYLNKHGHPRSYKRIIYNSMKGPYFIYKFRKAFNHF